MVKALVWSVTLLGLRSEDVDDEKGGRQRIEAFELSIWKRMERISRTEHILNEEMLEKVKEKRALMNIIRTRQKNLIGHIPRGNSLQREIMEGRMEGKRGRRRP